MHLFARRPQANSKVIRRGEQFSHSRSGRNDVVIAIDGFEVFSHALIHFALQIGDLLRSATIKVVVNFNGDFFHGFEGTSHHILGQDGTKARHLPIHSNYFNKTDFNWFRICQVWAAGANSDPFKKMWRASNYKVASFQ
jgi:hypothetical protein